MQNRPVPPPLKKARAPTNAAETNPKQVKRTETVSSPKTRLAGAQQLQPQDNKSLVILNVQLQAADPVLSASDVIRALRDRQFSLEKLASGPAHRLQGHPPSFIAALRQEQEENDSFGPEYTNSCICDADQPLLRFIATSMLEIFPLHASGARQCDQILQRYQIQVEQGIITDGALRAAMADQQLLSEGLERHRTEALSKYPEWVVTRILQHSQHEDPFHLLACQLVIIDVLAPCMAHELTANQGRQVSIREARQILEQQEDATKNLR
jgi:hypothetical protein